MPTLKAGELIWNADIASDTSGLPPSADAIRPLTSQGELTAPPIVSSATGPVGCLIFPMDGAAQLPAPTLDAPYVRIFDYHETQAAGAEWNFAEIDAGYDAIQLSFKLRAQDIIADGGDLRLSVGQASDSNNFTLNGSSNRPFLINFNCGGQVSIDHSSIAQRHTGNFNPAQTVDVRLYINDLDIEALPVTTPSGAQEYLPPNSILLYLDDQRVGQSTFDDRTALREFDTRPINLGRVSFHTLTSGVGIDFGLADIRIESLHPYYPGPKPHNEYQHRVLLSEAFPTNTSDVTSLAEWQRTEGVGNLPVSNGALVFDYANADNVSAQRFFRDSLEVRRAPGSNETGPYFYVSFQLTIDEAPAAGASGYFFGYNNPATIQNFRGFVWLSAGDSPGQAKLGLSTTGLDQSFASQSLVEGETYQILLRYDLSRNDSWLWINPDTDSEPDLTIQLADDLSYYLVNAITVNFQPAAQLGRFEISDMRAASSMRSALARGPFAETPTASITRGSNFAINSPHYDGAIDFYGNLTELNALGHPIVQEALWDKANLGTIGDRRNIDSSYAKAQTDLIMTHIDVSDARLSLFLQNNDESENAQYLVPLATGNLLAITTDDGVRHTPPFNETTPIPTADLILEYTSGEIWLRGVDSLTLNSASQSALPIARISIASRELKQLDFHFGDFNLLEPSEYRVFQRDQLSSGIVRVRGRAATSADTVEVFFYGESAFAGPFSTNWQTVPWSNENLGLFDGEFRLPSGGWHTAEIRALSNNNLIATQTINRLGVGEVFVCAGQSNSTNSGTTPVDQSSGMVAAFTGGHWQLGNDPFPGNHDGTYKGSYYSTLGDRLHARLGVPIAFASTGHGGTYVALWQPDVAYSYSDFTHARYNGLYDWTLHRIQQLGPNGFRSVLWHQGESDSSHTSGVERTSEQEYYDGLKNVIEHMRADAGWFIPWFVAQVSVWPRPDENPNGDENIQAAQMRLWSDGIAFAGANSDSIGVEYRQYNGSRVHFRPIGLMRHAELWEEKLGDHIDALNGGVNALDSDGDLLPDYWERALALPVNSPALPNANQDGDRYTDYEEFIAGSDPLNANDFPTLALTPESRQLAIQYRAPAHRRYQLWQSNNLQDWSLVRQDTPTVPTNISVETSLSDEPEFFRLMWFNDLEGD